MKLAGWNRLGGVLALGGAIAGALAACGLEGSGADMLLEPRPDASEPDPVDADASVVDSSEPPDPGELEDAGDGGREPLPACEDVGEAAGCPSGLAWGERQDSARYIKSAGTEFADECAAGSALVGVTASSQRSFIRQIRGRCAQLSLVADPGAPGKYRVLVAGNTMDLPLRGALVGGIPRPAVTSYNVRCPADAVVVGMSGQAGEEGDDMGVTHVVLTCAPIVVNRTEGGGFNLERGPTSTVEVGAVVSDDDLDPFTVPMAAPNVVTGLTGRAMGNPNQSRGIHAVGVHHRVLSLTMK